MNPIITFFSSIDFDFIYQRPQALVEQISRRGIPVYYFEKSSRKDVSLNRSRLGYHFDASLRSLDGCLTVVRVPRYLEVRGLHFRLRGRLMQSLVKGWVTAFLKRLSRQGRLIAVFEGVTSWQEYAGDFPFDVKCFDLIDDPEVFGDHPGGQGPPEALIRLLQSCDHVFYTSARLGEYVATHAGQVKSVRVPNGVLWEKYQAPPRHPEIEALRNGHRAIVGYVGYLGAWIDTDILAHCAAALADHLFVFVGPGRESVLRSLGSLPNVRLLGPRPHAEIPSLIAAFDVCLNPFRLGPIGDSTDPIKLYEYFACGKPVVSTPIREAVNLGDLLYIGADREDFRCRILAAAAESNPSLVARRKEFARGNSWDRRAETILNQLFPDGLGPERRTT